jgi:hypothetical protein
MIVDMGTLRITEAELARDIHAVLAKVRTGVRTGVSGYETPKLARASGRREP